MLLGRLLPEGEVITECPVSTSEGTKGIDTAWISQARWLPQKDEVCFTKAPEICIEVVSPNNSRRELREKKRLYFEAGAEEVWFRERDGRMAFFLKSAPEAAVEASAICPEFPTRIN